MLSYQHVFHAGNFADIQKHLTFSLLLRHLCAKEKPFTVFDTHAGAGRYALDDERALKTGEAQNGITKLLSQTADCPPEPALMQILDPWLTICRTYAARTRYPGSPELARCLMRPDDILILSELHPAVIEELRSVMSSDPLYGKSDSAAVKPHIHFRNGWEMITALTPPAVKRGIVLMDPSYEDESDFTDCSRTLCAVHKKWPAGILALWYPLLTRRKAETARMKAEITAAAASGRTPSAVIDVQLSVLPEQSCTGLSSLYGTGMLIVNPPYLLDKQLSAILPYFARTLGIDGAGSWSIRTV